jgi:hypothetical protein
LGAVFLGRRPGWGAHPPDATIDRVAYRLRRWPLLPEKYRTSRVYALLSVMSVRGVNRGWMLGKTRMAARELDLLLDWLKAAQVLERLELPQAARPSGQFAATFSAPALSVGQR